MKPMKPTKKAALLVTMVAAFSILPAGASTAGGFCHDRLSDERTNTVRMIRVCFSPTVVRIEPGETVTWKNVDPGEHLLGGVAQAFGDLHTSVPSGGSISYTFEDEGVYPYVCILHPGMAGAVVVGDGEGKVTKGSVTEATTEDDAAAAAPAAPAVPGDSGSAPWVPVAAGGALVALALAASTAVRRRRSLTAGGAV